MALRNVEYKTRFSEFESVLKENFKTGEKIVFPVQDAPRKILLVGVLVKTFPTKI